MTHAEASAKARPQPPTPVVTIPRICPGGTVVCVGSGPSLTRDDVASCQGQATVIAVNDAAQFAPFADALMASDCAWWQHHRGAPAFTGLKYCLERSAVGQWPDVLVPRKSGCDGIEFDPTALRSGRNSGAAAINLAVHFGARRILLIGYDMGRDRAGREHFFGAHARGLRNGSPYSLFRASFAAMVAPLSAAGIEVFNCSRETALECFPRMDLFAALSGFGLEALPRREVAA